MTKINAAISSIIIAAIFGSLPKIPLGIFKAVAIVFACTLVLVYVCAYLFSKKEVLKDYPLADSLIQYIFISISAIYLGESVGDAIINRQDLNVSSLGAAIFVGVFCVASVTESKISPAKKGDLPEVGRRITKERTADVALGTLINMVIPFIIGAKFSKFF